jgi:hypothetical protein
VIAVVVEIVPSHGGSSHGRVARPVFTRTATSPGIPRPSAKVVREQNAAIAATEPIAKRYLAPRNRGRTLSGISVAFAGSSTVGFVLAYTPPGGGAADATLDAIRFVKMRDAWRIDYVHRGHGSAYVNEDNYAPSGFLPGASGRNFHAYLPVLLALLAFIVLVVIAERRLRRD